MKLEKRIWEEISICPVCKMKEKDISFFENNDLEDLAPNAIATYWCDNCGSTWNRTLQDGDPYPNTAPEQTCKNGDKILVFIPTITEKFYNNPKNN